MKSDFDDAVESSLNEEESDEDHYWAQREYGKSPRVD